VALTGCIGATDRSEFDAEVRARGGGLTTEWIDEALALVADEVGAPSAGELEVLTLTITTSSRAVSVQARRGDRPDFVDTVTVVEGEILAVQPMQDADELPLDDLALRVDELPLSDIEALGDRALAEFGEPEAFVDSIRVSIFGGEHRIVVDVESERRTGRIRFDVDGNVVEVDA
jgi:hypothetical protein